MDKRLHRYNLKKLNHGKKHNLNRFITLMKQNHFLKTLPTTKAQRQMDLAQNFTILSQKN